MQCTEVKPLEYYVKEDGEWSKNENSKMGKAIGKIAKKQVKELSAWMKNNPDWMDTEEGMDNWRKLQKYILGPKDEDELAKSNNKIIENVCNENKVEI